MHKLLILGLTLLLTPNLQGQTGETDPGRLDQIQAQRLEKSAHPRPEQVTFAEKAITEAGRFAGRIPIGFEIRGLGPGAGPTIVSTRRWSSPGDRIVTRLWGVGTLHNFYNVGTGMEVRRFPANNLSLALEGLHADSPQLDYYGPGPNSSIHNQTTFRREDTLFDVRLNLQAGTHPPQNCRLGELLLNVGPGTDSSLPTTESVFGPSEAPGIDIQSNFLIGGCSVRADFRDFPEDPHKGIFVEAGYNHYSAQTHGQFSFHRVSGAAEQYIPFFNGKRVIAIRERTELSFHSSDQVVPFYLQPTLASDTELRGFRRYRFYDENLVALTAEYRWEINSALDLALFVDGGEVFHRPNQFSFSKIENSEGFGFIFKRHRATVARLDTGFSREGTQVWVRLNNIF